MEASGDKRTVRYVIFDRGNSYPKAKWIKFSNKTDDFKFSVNYGDLSSFDPIVSKDIGILNITEINVRGVKEIFDKHKDHTTAGIRAHFRVDESGLFRMEKIDATFETTDDSETEESTLSKIGNKISSFFGGNAAEEQKDPDNQDGAEKKENAETQQQDQQQTTTTANDPSSSSKATNETVVNLNGTDSNAAQQNKTQPKPKIMKESFKFDLVELDVAEMTKEMLNDSKSKLKTIKEKEKEKKSRAAAINALEAFIFDTRDKLEQDEFIKCSTEDERATLKQKIEEADAWLGDADDSVAVKAISDKLQELKNTGKDVFFRINEKKQRAKRLDELNDVLNISSTFVERGAGEAGGQPGAQTAHVGHCGPHGEDQARGGLLGQPGEIF